MNRLKITIKTDEKVCLERIGILVEEKDSYTNDDIIAYLKEMITELEYSKPKKKKPFIEHLKELGWEFRTETWQHPHDNDDVTQKHFSSPRMYPIFQLYDQSINLLQLEAEYMARRTKLELSEKLNSELHNFLTDYFKSNPEARVSPDINFNFNEQ